MNELQVRLEVQGAVQSYAERLLFQSGVPAHIVEDAFSRTLGYLKEKSIQEFLISASVPAQADNKEGEESGN